MSDDKKTVTLAVSGLNYATEYAIVAKGVLVDGKPYDLPESKFKTPPVTDVYDLEITTNSPGDELLADGADNLVLTAKLIDKVTRQVDINANDVVIAFSATYGDLANNRVTVQKGEASVVLTSVFSQKNLVSKIDAQIIEASGDYKELIGEVVGTKNVNIVLKKGEVDPDVKPALVQVNSNQADRVTAFFNKNVTVADFGVYDEKTKKFNVGADGSLELKKGVKIEVSQDANFAEGTLKKVLGLKPVSGNSQALEIVLAKSVNLLDNALEDNKEVYVRITQPSNIGDQVISKDFILSDTRMPEATSVEASDLKTVVVKFSKSIAKAQYSIDGERIEIDEDESKFGDFNPATLEDKRDILTIKTKDFMKAGTHSIQLSNIYDFAGLTDPNNISSSQSLDFAVTADEAVPTATVSVESPEQFRVKFNKEIQALDANGNKVDLSTKHVKLQVLDKKAGGTQEWKNVEDVEDKYDNDNVPVLIVKKVSASEYVFELTQDWTRIYDTKNTNKNYYNDQYRLFISKDYVINPANGKKNGDIVMLLDDPIMKSADNVSPVIKDIKQVGYDVFNVEMSKPVKLGPDVKGEPDTPPQGKETPIPVIEFLGKDKNGDPVTIKGKINGYSSPILNDKEFEVEVDKEYKTSIQTIVNEGGSQNWTLVVRSISDDVGNTAQTLTKDFVVKPDAVAEDKFEVAKVGNKPAITGKIYEGKEDAIEIVFTSDVQLTGTIGNALSPSNYNVNGVKLPVGSKITFTESGANADNKKVTVHLPAKTLSADFSNTITLSKDLRSAKGIKLSGANQFTFKAVIATDVAAVEDLIAKIPALGQLKLTDEDTVKAARDAFNKLKTDELKALVKNKATLEAAEEKIAELKKAQGDAKANLEAAKKAVDDVLVPAAEAAEKDPSKDKVEAAEKALADAKTAVKKVADANEKKLLEAKITLAEKKVTDARAAYDQKAAADLKAAQEAVAALFTDNTKTALKVGVDQAAINTAKAKVDVLSDSVKEKASLSTDLKKAQDLLDAATAAADEATVANVQNALDLTYVGKGDVNLPAPTQGTTITWVSDKPAVVDNNGKVTAPPAGQPNATVKLTATIKKGSAEATKTFTITVNAIPETPHASLSQGTNPGTVKLIDVANGMRYRVEAGGWIAIGQNTVDNITANVGDTIEVEVMATASTEPSAIQTLTVKAEDITP